MLFVVFLWYAPIMAELNYYNDWTVAQLRQRAQDLDMVGWSTLRKDDLIAAIEEREEEEEKDPADFSDMPLETKEAPDEIEGETSESSEEEEVPGDQDEDLEHDDGESDDSEEEEVSPDKEELQFKEHQSFRLTNDITFVTPNGVPQRLLAGRLMSDSHYDLDVVRRAGGVLVPVLGK